MDIDAEKLLKQQYAKTGKNPPKLYFLNMWEYDLFSEQDFAKNIYLSSLYSIAKDLDRNRKTAALKEYKQIRNSFEHKMLFINEKTDNLDSDFEQVSYQELIKKTKLLLVLTKSAILSLVYLIRIESIYLYKEDKEHS